MGKQKVPLALLLSITFPMTKFIFGWSTLTGADQSPKSLKVLLPGYVEFFCLLLGFHQLLAQGVQSFQRICDGVE